MTERTTPPSERTRLRRRPDRGSHELDVVRSILATGLVAHVGFVDDEQPYVIPMAYCLHEDNLYVHGSHESRALKRLAGGANTCVTVTHLDALVLARSAVHHSFNYRSAVVLGRGRKVEDIDEKRVALARMVEQVLAGRGADCRPPTDKELNATLVVAIPIDEASAKVRGGPALDSDEDMALDHWAGLLPLALRPGNPEPDSGLEELQLPDYLIRPRVGAE